MTIDFDAPLQAMLAGMLAYLPRIIVALVVFVVTLLVASPLSRAVERPLRRADIYESTIRVLKHMVRWGVILTGTAIALAQVNFDVTGFIAGLGIAGLTISLALQDIARNFIASMLVLARKPFNIGETVKIAGFSGTVNDISVMDTVLKTWDGELVTLRNTAVLNSPIINYSRAPLQRRTVPLKLKFGQDTAHSVHVFLEAIKGVPGVLEDPPPTIYASDLGDATISLSASFWVDERVSDVTKVHSDVILALAAASEREGL